jgi:alanine-glyoxylate transaminase / serine-glyoxylate transaminase / serine-pyruvate transaminase
MNCPANFRLSFQGVPVMPSALPFPRVLLGPGPSSVSPRVLDALGRAPIGYLDPELFTLLDEIRDGLRLVFGTKNALTFPLTGTGMAGMECCLANLIEQGDTAVIGVNGFFGGRMTEIARKLGANVVTVAGEWGKPLDPQHFADALKPLEKVKLVGAVHAETSTGVRNPVADIAALAHAKDALFLADAVTSLGGIAVEVDKSGIDVCYSGTQKCIGAPPGLSPLTISDRAYEAAQARQTPVVSWYFDWKLLRAYYDEPHAYHHTVPVNLLYALGAALQEIQEEGLEVRFTRHESVSARLMAGLAELGMTPFAADGSRLPTLNAVTLPSHITDEVAVRKRLLTEYGIEIGGGLGELKGKIWRIGTMGSSATIRNTLLLLSAFRDVL